MRGRFGITGLSFGHQQGDAALRRVAATLAAAVRGRDAVYRYGGEEFCLLLPETVLSDAVAVAERVRAAVALDHGMPGWSAGKPVTVSLGVASSAGESMEDILGEADAALYEAKRAGRNRVVAAGVASTR